MNTAERRKLIALLNAAFVSNARLQKKLKVGSPEWHACETTDDQLHDALALLGE